MDILRLSIQEREAREAEIDQKTANVLARNVALDEELMLEMVESLPRGKE